MKPPYRRRRLLAAVLVSIAYLAVTAFAQSPPEGRWRCYQPPDYLVLAWFDLGAGQIAVNGNPPVAVVPGEASLGLPAGTLPPWRHGFYLAPGSAQGDAERHTLVLAARADVPRRGRGWERLPRCYLTTH